MWFAECLLAVLAIGAARVGPGIQASGSVPQKPSCHSVWLPLEFLVGDWVGEGSGDPGQSGGGFTFRWELDKKILVRSNFADYPATKERAAFSHRDLMTVYPDAAGSNLRAIYFDNEGHVINYSVLTVRDSNVIQFLSDATPTGPRYRLSYTKTGNSTVSIKFEAAPPGRPEIFSPYIEAVAHRK